MTDITRDDLRVWPEHSTTNMMLGFKVEPRRVSDEEFDRLARERMFELGWQPPVEEIVTLYQPSSLLRALLTDECETCEGTGTTTDGESWGPDECPACGGRGWLPKDGVTIKPESEWAVNGHFVIFPLDWLEAENEQ